MTNKEDNNSNKDPFYTATLNQMGYMTTSHDEYTLEYLNFIASCSLPVLDIGTAYGETCISALKKGATVFANDVDSRHLDILWNRTPVALRSRLVLKEGRFPDFCNLDDNSLGAVLSVRVFHYFSGEEIEKSLFKIYKILVPLGKVFIVCDTPYTRGLIPFQEKYFMKRKENITWPGEIKNSHKYFPARADKCPNFFHPQDIDTLSRSLLKSGFIIEKTNYINRYDYPEDTKLDGRESVGIIGIKPTA